MKIKFRLKKYYFLGGDPTQKDMQFPDVGTQYRSEIFMKMKRNKTLWKF